MLLCNCYPLFRRYIVLDFKNILFPLKFRLGFRVKHFKEKKPLKVAKKNSDLSFVGCFFLVVRNHQKSMYDFNLHSCLLPYFFNGKGLGCRIAYV